MNDWLKDRLEPGYISDDDSAAGQLKKLEEKRIDELRQYVAYQQAENYRKERQAVIDRQKQRKHDFVVAGFSSVTSVLLTLLVEQFHKVLSFVLSIFS